MKKSLVKLPLAEIDALIELANKVYKTSQKANVLVLPMSVIERIDKYASSPAKVFALLGLTPRRKSKRLRRVRCKFCGELTSRKTAHRHDGGWVGDDCWDERSRMTE